MNPNLSQEDWQINKLKKIHRSSKMIFQKKNEGIFLFIRYKQAYLPEIYFEFSHSHTEKIENHLLLGFQDGKIGELRREVAIDADFKEHCFLYDRLACLLAIHITKECILSDDRNESYVSRLASALMTHLMKRYMDSKQIYSSPQSGLMPVTLDKINVYIANHLNQIRNVQQLASYVGLSEAYFSKMFKKSTGQSPYQYLVSKRMQMAFELLIQTQMSVIQIGKKVGIGNYSQFCQSFKRYHGFSPTNMRKCLQK